MQQGGLGDSSLATWSSGLGVERQGDVGGGGERRDKIAV